MTRLEPLYLANVLLFTDEATDYPAFFAVARACRDAALILRTNPLGTAALPVRHTLALFPGINTLQVATADQLADADVPPSVTRIVVFRLAGPMTVRTGRFPDHIPRVVEVKKAWFRALSKCCRCVALAWPTNVSAAVSR